MSTTSKRRSEFDKLKSDAADIWGEQREALVHASKFWQDAGAEAADVAVKDVAPRVRAAFEQQVKPAVATGVASASVAATHAKDRLVNDVAPAVSKAVQSGSLSDLAKDPAITDLLKSGKKLSRKAKRKALKRAAKTAVKHPKAAVKVAKTVREVKKHQNKSGIGAGGVFLIVLGVIGVGAVIFAAVQTLRADDELWVADDDDTATN
ncbi:MAG: hypothetical protein JWP75_3785 [Frondihabitans sp.]|nr:hypothetical protein [Frondihabitans sp.]